MNNNTNTHDYNRDLALLAGEIPVNNRLQLLRDVPETEMHDLLEALFSRMEPHYLVVKTHGPDELGRDLVILKKDSLGSDIVAVVVKRGDIRAKTVGDVTNLRKKVNGMLPKAAEHLSTEIADQIDMCFINPSLLRTVYKKLPTTRVLVILVGEISGQGHERLFNEIDHPGFVDVRDVTWLDEQFLKHYPQVYFHGATVDFIQSELVKHEHRKSAINTQMQLSDYFIEPIVATFDIPPGAELSQILMALKRKKNPLTKVEALLRAKKPIMMVGDVGTGKTTALAKMAIDVLRESYINATRSEAGTPTVELPVVVTATQILAAPDKEALISKILTGGSFPPSFKVKCLLVDAIESIPTECREEAIQKAKLFAKEWDSGLVITSRKTSFLRNPPDGFERVELLPFEFRQAIDLFKKILGPGKDFDSLCEGLERIKDQIPIVPLSLILLIELVEKGQEVPASVTELYERYMDLALGRDDKGKGIEVLFDYIIKQRFLATLAFYEFLQKERLAIPAADFDAFVTEHQEEFGYEAPTMAAFIDEIERAGLIDIGKEVAFRHGSFLDYFAAFFISDNRESIGGLNELLVDLYFTDQWADVTFFYIGLKRLMPDVLLTKLFEKPDTGLPVAISKFMVGRLLQAGWNSRPLTKGEGIKKAFAQLPSVRDRFNTLLKGPKLDVPALFSDVIVLGLTDSSFRSGTLSKELSKFYDKTFSVSNIDEASNSLTALWALKPYLTDEELSTKAEKFLEAISRSESLIPIDKARLLLILSLTDKDDKAITKSIGRKLKRIGKDSPAVFKALLPAKSLLPDKKSGRPRKASTKKK